MPPTSSSAALATVVCAGARSVPRRTPVCVSARHARASASVGKVFLIRFDSRALQTLAWYVGWQLQRPPRRDAHAFLCRTSIPVRCATRRTLLRPSDVPRDSRATVSLAQWPSRRSREVHYRRARKKERIPANWLLPAGQRRVPPAG